MRLFLYPVYQAPGVSWIELVVSFQNGSLVSCVSTLFRQTDQASLLQGFHASRCKYVLMTGGVSISTSYPPASNTACMIPQAWQKPLCNTYPCLCAGLIHSRGCLFPQVCNKRSTFPSCGEDATLNTHWPREHALLRTSLHPDWQSNIHHHSESVSQIPNSINLCIRLLESRCQATV